MFTSTFELFVCISVPLVSPNLYKVIAIDYSKISIKWKGLPQRYVRGKLRGYRVYIRHVSSSNVTNITVDPNTLELNVKGLQSESYYRISVKAFTSKGEGGRDQNWWIRTSKTQFRSLKLILQLQWSSFQNIGLLYNFQVLLSYLQWRFKLLRRLHVVSPPPPRLKI